MVVINMYGLEMTNRWHTISCKGGKEVEQEHEVGFNLTMELHLHLSYPSKYSYCADIVVVRQGLELRSRQPAQ